MYIWNEIQAFHLHQEGNFLIFVGLLNTPWLFITAKIFQNKAPKTKNNNKKETLKNTQSPQNHKYKSKQKPKPTNPTNNPNNQPQKTTINPQKIKATDTKPTTVNQKT